MKYFLSSTSVKTKLMKYCTENLLFTFLKVGVKSYGFKKNLIGIVSFLIGPPSIISYFVIVVVIGSAFCKDILSFLIIWISIDFILILTFLNVTLPLMISLSPKFLESTSKTKWSQSSIPTSNLIGWLSCFKISGNSGLITANSCSYSQDLNLVEIVTFK